MQAIENVNTCPFEQRITFSLREIAAQTDQGMNSIYRDIAAGHLPTTKNGRRRLVTKKGRQQYIDYLESKSV